MSTIASPRRRHGRIIAATLFTCALLMSGCAGTASPGSTSEGDSNSPGAQPNAAAYAQCMRDNGVPGFPDPDSSGEFAIDASKLGVSLDSEQFHAAQNTCAPLQPAGSANQTQEDYQAHLQYAQCMRDEGLAGFPDPQAPGSGTGTQQDNSGGTQSGQGFDPSAAQFRAAHEACAHLLPEGDEGPSLNSGQ